MGPRLGYSVHEVDQAVVINSTVLCQANLTRTAGGDALAAILHGVLQAAQ